jgi:hypothetical protein
VNVVVFEDVMVAVAVCVEVIVGECVEVRVAVAVSDVETAAV